MPRFDGRISPNLSRDWRMMPRVHFVNYSLAAGFYVRRLEVLGRIIVITENVEEGFAFADNILSRLQEDSGIEMVFGDLPCIAHELLSY